MLMPPTALDNTYSLELYVMYARILSHVAHAKSISKMICDVRDNGISGVKYSTSHEPPKMGNFWTNCLCCNFEVAILQWVSV